MALTPQQQQRKSATEAARPSAVSTLKKSVETSSSPASKVGVKDVVVQVVDNAKDLSKDLSVPSKKEATLKEIASLAKDSNNHDGLWSLFARVLKTSADKDKAIRLASSKAAKALVKAMSKHAVAIVASTIIEVADASSKWRVRLLCMKLVEIIADKFPDEFASLLPSVVPVVSSLMWSTKDSVRKAATEAMEASCDSIENRDLEPFVPELISTILDPDQVEECVYKLAATTFVQTVDSGTLSITVPLLVRGLKTRKTAMKRKCAIICENLSKLVKNATEAEPFLPALMPLLAKAVDEVADVECRGVCTRVLEWLERIQLKCEAKETKDKAAELDALVGKMQKDSSVFQAALYRSILVNCGGLNSNDSRKAEWTAANLDAKLFDTYKTNVGGKFSSKFINQAGGDEEDEADKDAEQLCDATFSLAYGSKILLNTARLKLRRGMRYGIVAQKSAGKTTLLRSISKGQVDGFPSPDELKTVFVEHDIQASQAEMNVVEFTYDHVKSEGVTRETVVEKLISTGFTDEMRAMPITSLSGGWKMKLALVRAILRKADILLLDEPTNHLDVINVQWVVDYLTGDECTKVTSLIVSHDTSFLDNVGTHIIHLADLKLDTYKGNLSKFVERFPEAKAYYDLSASTIKFSFPKPGPLHGVKSKGKPILSLNKVSYTYPGAPSPQLTNVSVRASMASRVACVGANGAGKSTMIKLLTGEMEPSHGTVAKHPNLRFAYVAQHAFHHIEQHLNKTPNEYIQWRYSGGQDKEALQKSTTKISPEEEKKMKKPIEIVYENEDGKNVKEKRVVEKILSRRKEGKKLNYEVKWVGKSQDLNTWYDRDLLVEMGFEKLLKELDRRIAAQEGTYARTLTQKNIEEHLENVGLERELGSHNRIASLSGGQKVKVVLGACTWGQPHLIILDEPTNYLDRDSLGALAGAIKDFEGGVVLITHNKEFAEATTRETWVVANNTCDIKGDPEWEKYAYEAASLEEQEEQLDAAGNKIEKKRTVESLTRKEKKRMKKEIKTKISLDAELTEFEELCATEWDL